MTNKHEWRKKEKSLYLPKNEPEIIEVPKLKFLTIKGRGNPVNSAFSDCVETLYSLAYTIKMTLKKIENPPADYSDFTVYPLEGVWSLNDTAKANFNGVINKDDFVYKLMIRQPDFVDKRLYTEMLNITQEKKSNPLLESVFFEELSEGRCVQMLHLGAFDDEPASFEKMEAFAEKEGLVRLSKDHREIYLSDARKVAPEKLKTVLRFQTKSI